MSLEQDKLLALIDVKLKLAALIYSRLDQDGFNEEARFLRAAIAGQHRDLIDSESETWAYRAYGLYEFLAYYSKVVTELEINTLLELAFHSEEFSDRFICEIPRVQKESALRAFFNSMKKCYDVVQRLRDGNKPEEAKKLIDVLQLQGSRRVNSSQQAYISRAEFLREFSQKNSKLFSMAEKNTLEETAKLSETLGNKS